MSSESIEKCMNFGFLAAFEKKMQTKIDKSDKKLMELNFRSRHLRLRKRIENLYFDSQLNSPTATSLKPPKEKKFSEDKIL
jgi:hypothetical protein